MVYLLKQFGFLFFRSSQSLLETRSKIPHEIITNVAVVPHLDCGCLTHTTLQLKNANDSYVLSYVLARVSARPLEGNKTTDFYPMSLLINSRCLTELLNSSKKTTSLLTARVIFNFRNCYKQGPLAYFPVNYTMEQMCVIFTPQQD